MSLKHTRPFVLVSFKYFILVKDDPGQNIIRSQSEKNVMSEYIGQVRIKLIIGLMLSHIADKMWLKIQTKIN